MTTPSAKRYLPWVVATTMFMEQLDSTILNTAVPSMAVSLHVTPLSLRSVVTSYIISLAVCIPISGWMADRFGSRRVFANAVAVFTMASIACGLAINVHVLVGARILQGLGASMMLPVGRLTILRVFPKAELLRAMNFVIMPALFGPLLGPATGGLIVDWLSWRGIFFVNVPVGLAALLLSHHYMPNHHGSPRRLDIVGVTLFGGGIALVTWLLEIVGEHPFDLLSATALASLAFGLLALYGWRARRAPNPIFDHALFEIRTFRHRRVRRLHGRQRRENPDAARRLCHHPVVDLARSWKRHPNRTPSRSCDERHSPHLNTEYRMMGSRENRGCLWGSAGRVGRQPAPLARREAEFRTARFCAAVRVDAAARCYSVRRSMDAQLNQEAPL
jgi:hypothetical protein